MINYSAWSKWYCLLVLTFSILTLSSRLSVYVFVLVSLEVVQQLSVETESEGSVRVRWRGVSGARAYRLVWGPFTGRRTHQTSFFLTAFIYCVTYLYIFVFVFCSLRSWCRDRGGRWWHQLLHVVRCPARYWVHCYYYPTVRGKHRGLSNNGQIQDR